MTPDIYDALGLKKSPTTEVTIRPGDLLKLKETTTRSIGADEKLCEKCGGLGLCTEQRSNGAYIVSCDSCFGSIAKKCKHCAKQIQRNRTFCECIGGQAEKCAIEEARREDSRAKQIIREMNTPKISLAEFEKNGGVYVVINDEYYECDEVEMHLEENPDLREHTVYASKQYTPKIHASNIIENAFEDGPDNFEVKFEDELQALLDGWVEKQSKWYVEDQNLIIEISPTTVTE